MDLGASRTRPRRSDAAGSVRADSLFLYRMTPWALDALRLPAGNAAFPPF
jgi:hypothetical protein